MSWQLRLIEDEVQLAALAFLAAVYAARLVWLFRFPYRAERTHPAGSAAAGVAVSLANVAMPWAMESTRRDPLFYLQFAVFHVGVILAILASFVIPYWPGLLAQPWLVPSAQILLSAALLVGLLRLHRRLRSPALRLVSAPDDYLSLLFTLAFFATAILALPNDPARSEWPLFAFFGLTAVFLVYVPFSKIGHYLYYPFTRFFFGRSAGHRGVFPRARRLVSPPRQAPRE